MRAIPETVAAEHAQLIGDIDRLLVEHGRGRSALLPLLQDLMRQYGTVTDVAMQVIADRLEVPPAQVMGVVSFYSFLHGGETEPRAPSTEDDAAPNHVVRLCRTLSCELAGAAAVAEQLRQDLTGREGRPGTPEVRLELVHCIGLCDRPPAMLVDDLAVGGVTPERAKAIMARLHR